MWFLPVCANWDETQSDKLGVCISIDPTSWVWCTRPRLFVKRLGRLSRSAGTLTPLHENFVGRCRVTTYLDDMGAYRKISGLGRTSDQGPKPGRGRLGRWGPQERAATQQLNGKIGRRLGVACALSMVLVHQNDATPPVHPAANSLPTVNRIRDVTSEEIPRLCGRGIAFISRDITSG